MRFPRITLCAGALLALTAAHPAAKAPARKAKPVAEQTEAPAAEPEAVPADEPASPPAEAAAPAEATETPGETAAAPASDAEEPPADAAAPPAEATEAPAGGTESPAEPAASAEEAAPGPAVPAKGAPPTREFMVGVWTEDLAKCNSALEFKADGTLIGPFPRWELTDDGVLTMAGNRQKIWLTVVDRNTMHSRRSETDPPRTLKRCPATAPSPPQP